jgi:hypothetical protein
MTATADTALLTPAILRTSHAAGLPWPQYLQAHASRTSSWGQHLANARLSPAQQALLGGFTRRMPVLVLTGAWCGDCAVQCPMLGAIAGACPAADVRFLEQESHHALAERVRINSGTRGPTVIWCAEDFEFCSVMGDRTLARYRAMAARQLGASCPLPGAPVAADEAAATMQGWIDEFERVQLMLRLSPRLRQLHGD